MLKAILRLAIGCAFIVISISAFGTAKAQIAPGVTQSAAHTANITGTVSQSDGTPVAGARVQLMGTAVLSTKTDERGTFDFVSVPWGSYAIVVTSATGTISRKNVQVNGDIIVSIQYQPEGRLAEIAHVSTASAGGNINVTPASIVSVNPSDYALSGNSSWKALLNQIPGVTVGGSLRGGCNVLGEIPDGPFQPIILSINGALPYETSITFDGMPLENSSVNSYPGQGVDLSYLPMTIFDTADVVRGPGANAPSIVNSIGGSMVLHAPNPVSASHFDFSISNDAYGGVVSNLKAALKLGRLSATVVYGLNNSPGPFGNSSVISAYSETPATVNGMPFAAGGFAGYTMSPSYQNCYDCGVEDSLLYCCVTMSTDWVQHSGAVALSYNITPRINAQVFYAGASLTATIPYQFMPVYFNPGPGYSGGIAPGEHVYPWVYQTSGAEATSLLEEKLTVYTGKGVIRLGALQNNSFDQDHYSAGVPSGKYTVYGTGTYCNNPPTCSVTSPAIFNGTTNTLAFGPFFSDQFYWSNNRDLLASFAMPINSTLNAGVSYVMHYYNAPADDNYDGFADPPIPPSVSLTSREVRVYVNQILSQNLSLDASWYFAGGAYHVQSPSDATGHTFVDSNFSYSAPRVDAVWRPNPNVAVRAAAGGGFALAPIGDIAGTYAFSANGTPICNLGICTESLRNVHLQPERSFGVDIGTDVRFKRDTTLSLDAYRTNLYGQLYQSASLTGTYAGFPLYTTQYGNLTQSRYEGVNLNIRHDVPSGIYWNAGLGLTRAYVVNVPDGFYNAAGATCDFATGANCQNTYLVPGSNFNGQFQSTVPYATANLQLGYRWARNKYIDITPTYFGNNNSYFQRAFVAVDAHASYPLTRNFSLIVAARNITGIYDQNYQVFSQNPTLGAPTIAGQPYPLYGMPYGPRTVIVTARLSY